MPAPRSGPVRFVAAWCNKCLFNAWVAMRNPPLNLDVQCPGCSQWLKSTKVRPVAPPGGRCAWAFRVRRP